MPNKNIKRFGHFENGLIEVKLGQLIRCKDIDEIVLSTDDDKILDFAKRLNCSKLKLHRRDKALSASSTSTDELVGHVTDLIPEGHVLWTHVTSPFVDEEIYCDAIRKYRLNFVKGYDSLMSVLKIHGFLWDESAPINYDRDEEKWPRTQTLEPIYEVNSGIFLASTDIYKACNDRIGKNPFLYSMEPTVSFDIDWPDDFALAESMLERRMRDATF